MTKNEAKKFKLLRAVLAALLVVVMAGAIVLGVGFGVYGKDTSQWFKPKQDSSQGEEQQPEQNPEDPTVIEAVTENGIKLMSGMATTASDGTTSKELTATVTPADASVLSYSWSIAFANPSSTWANGKTVTDYVTVTQNSSNKLKATLTFKKRFSEQIIVSISCDLKPEVKASATVDCYKELKSFGFCFTSDYPASNNVKVSYTFEGQGLERYDNIADGYFTDDDYSITYTTEYGEGTITPDVKLYMQIKSSDTACGSAIHMGEIIEHDDLTSGYIIRLAVKYNGVVICSADADLILIPSKLTLDNTSFIF